MQLSYCLVLFSHQSEYYSLLWRRFSICMIITGCGNDCWWLVDCAIASGSESKIRSRSLSLLLASKFLWGKVASLTLPPTFAVAPPTSYSPSPQHSDSSAHFVFRSRFLGDNDRLAIKVGLIHNRRRAVPLVPSKRAFSRKASFRVGSIEKLNCPRPDAGIMKMS